MFESTGLYLRIGNEESLPTDPVLFLAKNLKHIYFCP